MPKILVIDDDESFRNTLVASLEKQGFQVFQTSGGAKGVQVARDHQPDLILCDVSMEGADGRLTLFALRRDPAIASIPFILMSGVALSGEALPGTGRGADGFLLKPFTHEKLLTTIEGCLSKVEQSVEAVERTKDNDAPDVSREEGLPESLEQIVHVSFAEALSKGPPPAGNLAVPIFSHGSLEIELYTPEGQDPQKPHNRDEVYFVAQGKGLFFDGAQRHPVEAGSFLFVPAGHLHRFEAFSSDFAVWVAFYGPDGGESNA